MKTEYYKKWVGLILVAIMLLGIMPLSATAVEEIVPTSATLEGRSIVFNFNNEPTWTGPQLTVNGHQVGPFRYDATIDGVVYEAVCLQPNLPGPENPPSPPYVIRGTRNYLVPILRYGHPNNARMTDSNMVYYYPNHYAAYVTRTAAVFRSAPNWPNATLSGSGDLHNVVSQLANQTSSWQSMPYMFEPARWVRINGMMGEEEVRLTGTNNGGGMVVSDIFHITNSHANNPVMFQWWNGTPAGTQLLDAYHNLLATYPNLPANNSFQAMSFRLAVPENAAVELAGVDVVGIHNAYAGQVWSARTTFNYLIRQELAFYIPRMLASAAMWPPQEQAGQFRILKTDLQDVPLAGAVFELTGNDPQLPMTVTVPESGWTSPPLQAGIVVTVTEIEAPIGHSIGDNPTQTVTISPGQTEVITLTFRNPPTTAPGRFRILKTDLRGRPLDGAVFQITGPDPQMPMSLSMVGHRQSLSPGSIRRRRYRRRIITT